MAHNEFPSTDNIEEGIGLLSHYLSFYQPTLETTDARDPFILAKDFQRDINRETSENVKVIMGFAGRDQLNDSIPDRLLVRRLAVVTNYLFALKGKDFGSGAAEDYQNPVLVSGVFEYFSFSEVNDKKQIMAEFVMPKFLRPRLDQRSEFANAKRVIVPVDAIGARIYDPETFFHPDFK